MDRERFTALDAALVALQNRVGKLADAAARDPAKTQLKRYAAGEQVVARLELAGPEKRLPSTRAGIDVHGDGSTEAYVGRIRRRAVAQEPGEDGIAALRRALMKR